MRLRMFFSLSLVCIPGVALALTPAQELTRELEAVKPAIVQDQADTDADAEEASLEATAEFFPDDGTDLGDRMDVEGSDEFVLFRLNGVPYLLKDVPVKAWFAPYVRDMADRGIVTGYKNADGVPTGIFGPERGVTLEELAKMAIEAAATEKTACPAAPKNPLAAGSWSAPYVSCAESNAFAVFADGTVNLRRSATRAEVVMTVLQAFGRPIRELTEREKLFTDVTPSTLFAGSIKTAVEDAIVSGYQDAKGNLTGEFGPERGINRAEVSKILSIALQVYSR